MIDVDRDRLWGDGLAASSPVGLCRKFRREDSQKARLERKGLQYTSCQWLCGVSIVSHEALCSFPAAAGLPLTAEKSFPVVK